LLVSRDQKVPCDNAPLYEAVMRKAQELQPQFQPTQVIADFEEAPAAQPFR